MFGLRNPFARIEIKGSHAVDDIYGSRWATKSVNCLNSNGGQCCNCLWRRAKIAHHMMYIPRWKVWWLIYIKKVKEPSFIYKKLSKKSSRLYNREVVFLHIVGVCKHCHRPGAAGSVHSRDGWVGYEGLKLLNHNTALMRWKLRAGWLLTWTVSAPIRLLFYVLYKALGGKY